MLPLLFLDSDFWERRTDGKKKKTKSTKLLCPKLHMQESQRSGAHSGVGGGGYRVLAVPVTVLVKHALKRCILGTQRLKKMERGKQGVEAIERRAEIESAKHVRSGGRAGGGKDGGSEEPRREGERREGRDQGGRAGKEGNVFPKREKLH